MAGLGSVSNNNGLFLSIAGGFIWNRKAEEGDPDYATQTFTRVDKTEGVRKGARYADLTGMIIGVAFRTHAEYGESINVTVDSDGERYILSISTNNRYSQDMMKMLLLTDLSKEVFIKPYDFVGEDKKRAMGISFRQGGEKISLKFEGAPTKEKEWFRAESTTKKDIRRFFEDLNEWFVAEIEEKVCPLFVGKEEEPKSTEPAKTEKVERVEKVEKVEKLKATPIKMKKALKAYITENYEGKELPKLSKEDLIKWYELCLEEEELPFEDGATSAEVSSSEIDKQLEGLLGD